MPRYAKALVRHCIYCGLHQLRIKSDATARGCPFGFVLTPGEVPDVRGSGPLFRKIAGKIAGKIKALLADRGYGADASRSEIAMHGIQAGNNRQVQPKPSRPFAHVLSRCTASLS